MEEPKLTSGCGYTLLHSPVSSTLILSRHDSVLGGGGGEVRMLSLPEKGLGVKQVSCGRNHFMVLATNGQGIHV